VAQNFQWPLSEQIIADFIYYTVHVKNLQHSTIKSYISSLALYQNLRNLDSSNCTSLHTKLLLQGVRNLEIYKENKKETRKAMSYPMLKILCHQIACTNWPNYNKQVIWAVMCVAFFGSMRLGELLSSRRDCFNPHETLLWENLKFFESSVIITVKVPKSKNKQGEYIDIFENPDGRFCPVMALKALKKATANFNSKSPVFTFENGSYLTKEILNSTMHALLHPILGQKAYQYSGHSFRAGLPSALASFPDLVEDEQVKSWGRWKSNSFKLYTRLKTSQKKFLFDKILVALERQLK
jgi:hypothetical protein